MPDQSPLARRRFLKALAATGAGVAVPLALTSGGVSAAPSLPPAPSAGLPGADPSGALLPGGVFTCGVSSGSPAPDGAVIWTRVQPPRGSSADIDVAWQVSPDAGFSTIAASGVHTAGAASDWTVKIQLSGLGSNRNYWYRFFTDSALSPVGRTRTSPAPGASVDHMRFAVATCQNWTEGYYPAWNGIARSDVDFTLFLGDYIYEYGGFGAFRYDPVILAKSKADYRAKYKLYRSDAQHQAALANHPIVPIWDDHEVVNDRNETTDPVRVQNGYDAWFEYMPYFAPEDEPYRIHRTLQWGDLADMWLLDGRSFRSDQASGGFVTAPRGAAGPNRGILGPEQRDWMLNGVASSAAAWKLIAQDVMFLPWRVIDLDEPWLRTFWPDLVKNAGFYPINDNWDGYQWERRLILESLRDSGVQDTMILTGDDHCFWTGKITPDIDDPNAPVVAVEYTIGSVSSGSGLEYLLGVNEGNRPGLLYSDLANRGYGIVDLTPERSEVTYHIVDAKDPTAESIPAVRFTTPRGTTNVQVERLI